MPIRSPHICLPAAKFGESCLLRCHSRHRRHIEIISHCFVIRMLGEVIEAIANKLLNLFYLAQLKPPSKSSYLAQSNRAPIGGRAYAAERHDGLSRSHPNQFGYPPKTRGIDEVRSPPCLKFKLSNGLFISPMFFVMTRVYISVFLLC